MKTHTYSTGSTRPSDDVPPGLVCLHPFEGRAWAIEGAAAFVGREPLGRGFVIDHASVSRSHLQLSRGPQGVRAKDLGSRNGTLHNGARLSEALLRDGDVLRLGEVLLLFVADVRPYLGERAAFDEAFGGVVGPALRRTLSALERMVREPGTLLLLGETGTGKELLARAAHRLSGRGARFNAVNCAAVPEALFESQFFGHRKGAFSGANVDAPGLFRASDGGTLFLDEVGELPAVHQAKLLRVLETREVLAVGESTPVTVDVRVVAATHQPLFALTQQGRFRADLYARLANLTLEVPPLRARRDELPALTRALLGPGFSVSPEFLHRLAVHTWPMNVRELANTLQNARLRASGPALDVEHLPPQLLQAPTAVQAEQAAPPRSEPRERQARPGSDVLKEGIARHEGNVTALARELDRDRALVHRWLRELGVDPAAFRK